jgi:hypothetical protein
LVKGTYPGGEVVGLAPLSGIMFGALGPGSISVAESRAAWGFRTAL